MKKQLKKHYQPLLAGALLSLAFAPVAMPGLGVISLAWFFYLLRTAKTALKSFTLAWIYGIGLFGAGTSWIYISIHTYGQAEPWLAFILTVLFSLFMGLYPAFFGLSFWILLKRKNIWIQSVGFAALWIIFEYIRANLFTGFPWLLLGFSQTETPMKYLMPIMGVYGLSFFVALSGCLLTIIEVYLKEKQEIQRKTRWIWPALLMIAIYIFPAGLTNYHWTKPDTLKVPISIIQGNIDENEKWKPGAYEKTLSHYIQMTYKIPEKTRIIVWPEGAIPLPYPQAQFFLDHLSELMKKNDATLVTGIPYTNKKNPDQYYNAMMVLGNSSGEYFKHHLVPFGEYLPAKIFRDIVEYFKMPIYETPRGKFHQPLLNIENIPTLPFICYEIAYADILLKALPAAKLLITISDDAWFGHSMARAQHLQMAQMRSLQSGRYQIVATNNGISAVINAKGEILSTVPSFETRILNSYIEAMSGSTLWSKIGDNWIVFVFSLLLCLCVIL